MIRRYRWSKGNWAVNQDRATLSAWHNGTITTEEARRRIEMINQVEFEDKEHFLENAYWLGYGQTEQDS